ncbi:AAA family ATPase, partial [Yersinia enterocolitica]
MYIRKITINNYRNFHSFEAELQKLTIVIGENDSGKTNFFTALSLPLSGNQIDFNQKRLRISDINKDSIINFFTSVINEEPEAEQL